MSEFVISINGNKRQIKIVDNETLLIDGKKTNFELSRLSDFVSLLRIDNKVFEVSKIGSKEDNLIVSVNGKTFNTLSRTLLRQKASDLLEKAIASHSNKVVITAPMPGMILKVKKNQGDLVKKDDSVIILEAMKMENEIKAPVSGKISELKVTSGIVVEKNSFLFSIE